MGLPIKTVNLPDLNKAKSKSSLLRPLPVNKIMTILKEDLKEMGYRPNEEMKSLGPLHQMIVSLRDKLLKFTFRDWRYSLTDIYNWGTGSERITIELFAERKNMEMKLTVNKTLVSEWEMRELASNPSPQKPNMTIMDGVRLLLDFFNKANENIEEWDRICMNHKPQIVEEPLFEDMIDWLMFRFDENVEYDYHMLKEEGYFNSFWEFQNEREYCLAEITEEIWDINYEKWEFGPHSLFVEFEELGNDPYYGYLVFNVYIKTGDVGIVYFIDSLELPKGNQYFYDEFESILSQFEYDLYGAARQWNQILEG